jgi:HAMP domain-containing protein
MRLKLFTKFILLLLLLAVIPAAIVGLRTIEINRVGMQNAILELHTHIASFLADDIQKYLEGFDREIQYILRTLSAQMTWADRQSVLQALLDTNENFASVSIIDRKGQELLKAYNPNLEKTPRLVSMSKDKVFQEFWKHPTASAISRVYFFDNDPRITIIYPLGDNHCLNTTISLAQLWSEISQTRIAKTGYAFLVDEQGTVSAHRDMKLAQQGASANDIPILKQVLKAVTVGSSEYRDPKTKNEIVGAYAPVKGLKWFIIIQQNKSEAYVSVYRMKQQAAVLIIISIGVAIILAVIIARGLTLPMEQLTEAAKHIVNKDFSIRVKVKTHDELRDLAETFNEMTSELEHYNKMQIDKIIEEKTKTDAIIFSIADGILMTDSLGNIQVARTNARRQCQTKLVTSPASASGKSSIRPIW